MSAKLFLARFDGRCRGCGEDIDAGDQVGFIDGVDGVHCAGCIDWVESNEDYDDDLDWAGDDSYEHD